MELSTQEILEFQTFIKNFYLQNSRSFAWRSTTDPYAILISEVMLQQTQTDRVTKKYAEFMQTFSNFDQLAQASLHEVLAVWQGLGYNRRGKYLHECAKKIVAEYNGLLPAHPTILLTLPGIGSATASSICAFAFNMPTVFIETNIRTVFLHTFFKDQEKISDKELFPLIEATVETENARAWYYALMDYGVHLKKLMPNPSRNSKHYTRQSTFKNSSRQIRGQIIKLLTQKNHLTLDAFHSALSFDAHRINLLLEALCKEKIITRYENTFSIM